MKQITVANSSQEIKAEIQHLINARESLQKNQDISGSMVKITKTMNKMKPLLSKQSQYIKNFLQSQESTDSNSKQSQTRRYASRICDMTLCEINELISVGEEYFTIDVKNSWNKVKNEFEKLVQVQRDQIEKTNLIEFLFKVINLKDKLFKQFIKSIIYRKCLLWKDLNIIDQGFVHSQKKKITKSIEDYIISKNYAPSKPQLEQIHFDNPGRWTLNKNETETSSLSEFLRIFNQDVEDLFNIIRNYSNLNEEQRNHSDIKRNQKQVRSLREEIEQANTNLQLMEKKYREAVSKDQKLDIVQMKERLRVSEESLEAKEIELKQLKFEFRDSGAQMSFLKDKIKELESDLDKVTNHEMKKLKELELLQFTLTEEFNRIHQKMNNFGTMFEFESDGKKSLAKEIIAHKESIEKMAIMLGKQKNINSDLKLQIRRLNQIIIELGLQFKESSHPS